MQKQRSRSAAIQIVHPPFTGQLVSDLVGNTEARFSHIAAHIKSSTRSLEAHGTLSLIKMRLKKSDD